MTAHSAEVGDAAALRGLRLEVHAALTAHHDETVAARLRDVLWELATNVLEHSAPEPGTIIRVEVSSARIEICLPGAEFDSVSRASESDAHGLDTCAWKLALSSWTWAHHYQADTNQIILERGPQ